MKKVAALIFAAAMLAGCESRSFDGTTYRRTTLGRSSTEGVKFTRSPDGTITLEVQASGSEPGEVMIEGFRAVQRAADVAQGVAR